MCLYKKYYPHTARWKWIWPFQKYNSSVSDIISKCITLVKWECTRSAGGELWNFFDGKIAKPCFVQVKKYEIVLGEKYEIVKKEILRAPAIFRWHLVHWTAKNEIGTKLKFTTSQLHCKI